MCHFICFLKIWYLFFVKNIEKTLFSRKMGKMMEFVVEEGGKFHYGELFIILEKNDS